MRYVKVSRAAVVKHRRKQQQDAIARAKYETRHPKRSHHNKGNEKKVRDTAWLTKPFIMWDGEGPKDAGYALFGNSDGMELCNPHLGTRECLNLILDCASSTSAIHVWFGGNYDVSMILHELPHRNLRALHNFTRTVWKGYELEHVPHKWFRVKYGNISCKLYDIRSFFAGDYISALRSFGIGTPAQREAIAKGKRERETFVWAEIEYIKKYFRLELKLGPPLMETLRTIFADAGYIPRSWHGPGALARMALKRHKVYDAMAECPKDVRVAAQYAFAGGRFELFLAGHIQEEIYNADIHSAYPHYATKLPNLNRGKWKYTREFQAGKFGVYHIRYCAKPDNTRPFPLFRRLANGCVVWPSRVEGWYWAPEAELVANDPDATFIEGWVFEEDNVNDRPFAWLAEYYMKRRRLQNAGSAAEYTFKLIINSVYGQLAQRAGWDRKNRLPPKSHQLEWAGYITSSCRAAVYRAASKLGDKLVSIDTDGIYSTSPIDEIHRGEMLGEWEISTYADAIFWQSGIYCLKKNDGWKKAKSRGIKRGSYAADDLLSALDGHKCEYPDCEETGAHIHLAKRMFITYGLADIHGWEKHNTWIDEPHSYEMGGGKRMHFSRACKTFCDSPRHRLAQWEPAYGVLPEDDMLSHKHKLPWLDPPDDSINVFAEVELYNADHLDTEDMWMLDYNESGQAA